METGVGDSRYRRPLLLLIVTVSLLTVMSYMVVTYADDVDAADTWVVQSGTCGEGIEWTLDSTFTLTLTGYGEIPEFADWSASEPWHQYAKQVNAVVIDGEINNIGQYAFDGYTSLRTVEIRSDLYGIQYGAFMNCSLLKTIQFYGTVECIHSMAFSSCISLKNIDLPIGLTLISNDAFSYCTSLETIEIPFTVKNLDNSAFRYCSSLKTVTLNEGLEFIGSLCFMGTAITHIEIPDSVVSINNDAFLECNLAIIDVGKGISNLNPFTSVGTLVQLNISGDNPYMCDEGGIVYDITKSVLMYVPSNTEQREIVLPSTVLMLDNKAFSGCMNVESIVLSENLVAIGDYTFNGCTSLSTIVFPESLTSIGSFAFQGCKALEEVILPSHLAVLGGGVFKDCTSLKVVDLGDELCEVPHTAFSNCKILEYVDVPDSVYRIGTEAFKGCYSLEEVNLGSGLSYIDTGAFQDCRSLASISIPDRVNSVEPYTFSGCSSLERIELPESFRNIDYFSFYDCRSLTSISIPDGTTTLKDSAFYGCASLASVYLPDSLTEIQNFVFYGCASLKEISIPDGVTSIGSETFASCYSLENVSLPKGLTSIEYHTFYNCSALREVLMPDYVISIAHAAFEYCTNLEHIELPDNLVSIGQYAFRSCGLKTISIPEKVTMIDQYTFYESRLVDVHLPDNLMLIGENAFGLCYYLQNINLPHGLKSIGACAFEHCQSLKSIEIPSTVNTIDVYTFRGCWDLTSVTLPEGVTTIQDYAFWDCRSLISFTMSDNVVKIGTDALSECNRLSTMYVSKNLATSKEIWTNISFKDSTGTIEITDVDEIKGHWFSGNMDGTLLRDALPVSFIVDGVLESVRGAFAGDTVQMYTRVGYTIEWEPSDVEIHGGTFTMPANSITFVGVRTPLKYQVTMDPCNGTYDTVPEGWVFDQGVYTKMFDYGTSVLVIQEELKGLYRPEATLSWGLSDIVVHENGLFIHASWTVNRYSVTWLHENGNLLSVESYEYGTMPWYPGSTPQKMSTEYTTYTFVGWSPAVTEVTGNATYTAVFNEETRYYKVDIVINDVVTSMMLPYGATPNLPENPQKPSSESTVYTFSSWSPAPTTVVEDAMYVAIFDESIRYYTITWMNDDATSVISTSQVRYGDIPFYAGDDPVKESSLLYKYTFIGWSPNIVEVTGDAFYCATYVQTIISEDKFNVTWRNHDGEVLELDIYVDYGTLPTYEGPTPVKAPTDQYTYAFIGWSPNINIVTSDITYTAEFSEKVKTYTVTWLNGDSLVALDLDIPYGTIPGYTGPAPVKAADRQYTYTFTGWDRDMDPITGDTTFTATFDRTLNKYPVSWQNHNGSTIKVDQVAYGTFPVYEGDAPVKPSTEQYDYKFTGWSPGISAVTGEAYYVAQFEAILKKYTVTWKDDDGSVLAYSYNVAYGSIPLYPYDVPVKDRTEQYRYTFTGWSPALEYVTSDVTYTAVYSSEYMRYSVTWKDESGSVLEYDASVPYGSMPEYNGPTPVKGSDSEFRYMFSGWSPAVTTVTGDVVYTAVYNSTVNTYSVTWVDAHGTALEIDNHVPYGTIPTYDSAAPTMVADDQYSYEFDGWSPIITAVTGDITYTAVFLKTVQTYTVTWMDGDGNVLEVDEKVSYGTVPTYNGPIPTKAPTDQYTYTFAGWTSTVTGVTSDTTYIAFFTTGISTYTVTWKNDSGVVLAISYGVEYNSIPVYDGIMPTKASDGRYEYRFSGWSPVLGPVTSDTTYTATFEGIGKLFTVRWVNWDGSILEVDNDVEYGTVPVYDGDTPARASDVSYSYAFHGWSPDVTGVMSDTTYTAVFSQSTLLYTVRWLNEDGTLLMESKGLSADMIPAYNGPMPVKDPTEVYTYTFIGWDKEIVSASQVLEYSARFEASYRLYDITWRNDTGEILAIIPTQYGSIPVYEGLTPVKASDAAYRYTFNTWSPQPDVVKGEATYTAVYERSDMKYTISWLDFDGSILSIDHSARYGDVISVPDVIPERDQSSYYEYTFLRWGGYVDGMKVTSDHIFTAVYEEHQVLYPLTFIDYNGRSTTMMYKAGDMFVDAPDPYETAPAGCIAYWEQYSLDGSMENIVRLQCVSYLEYGYITIPGSPDVRSRASEDVLLAVTGVNANIDQWYGHLGNHYYIEIPETTLDGRTVTAISSVSDRSLMNIKFGGNIRHVSEGAFGECVNLSSFTVIGSTYYSVVGGALLTASGESLVCLPYVGDVYHLPDTVREIRASAISGKLGILYIDGNVGLIRIADGANVSGNIIELRPTIQTTELSVRSLPTNNTAHTMQIIPHDMYGDRSDSTVYAILAIAVLAVLIEMVAAYRPAVLKNRHVWAFFAMVTVCATAMFVYTAVETVGSNMDTYFTVTLVIWLASMVFGSAATFTTYIMGNKNRNVTALGSRGRMLVQVSTVLSIIGAMMLLIASVGDVARVSDEWSTILTILSSTVLVANVLSLVASKKIFSEVMFEQRRMDGEE